jgi:WD40 repeat protein
LDKGAGLLATACSDNVVRLWNPVVTKNPITLLYGHKEAIIDVLIIKYINALFSLSKDAVSNINIVVWNLRKERKKY